MSKVIEFTSCNPKGNCSGQDVWDVNSHTVMSSKRFFGRLSGEVPTAIYFPTSPDGKDYKYKDNLSDD